LEDTPRFSLATFTYLTLLYLGDSTSRIQPSQLLIFRGPPGRLLLSLSLCLSALCSIWGPVFGSPGGLGCTLIAYHASNISTQMTAYIYLRYPMPFPQPHYA